MHIITHHISEMLHLKVNGDDRMNSICYAMRFLMKTGLADVKVLNCNYKASQPNDSTPTAFYILIGLRDNNE